MKIIEPDGIKSILLASVSNDHHIQITHKGQNDRFDQ